MSGFQPMTFGFSMRNVVGYLGADGIQKFGDQDGSGYSIHIIVPKYQDVFLSQDGIMYAADGCTHVLHGRWIRQMVKRRGQKTVCQGRGVDAPVCQKRCEDRAALKMGEEAIEHLGIWLKDFPFFHKKAI